jgi:hypothetical protein
MTLGDPDANRWSTATVFHDDQFRFLGSDRANRLQQMIFTSKIFLNRNRISESLREIHADGAP